MTLILTGLTVLALVTWWVWERQRPAFPWGADQARIGRNFLLGLVGLGTTFLVVTPVSLGAAEIGPGWRQAWPLWLRLCTDLLLLEFFIYWWHRANHEVPFLWRFHRVHHYDEFLDVTSALRFHPGEVILSACLRGSYVLATDISVPSILLFDSLVIIAAGFHHSNVRLPQALDARLRRVVVSPHHHRIHHIPERQYTDSNYGTLFSFWDRLFGSFREAPATWASGGTYGVEGAEDQPFSALMIDPLRSPSSGS